jgi:hypothetical protein
MAYDLDKDVGSFIQSYLAENETFVNEKRLTLKNPNSTSGFRFSAGNEKKGVMARGPRYTIQFFSPTYKPNENSRKKENQSEDRNKLKPFNILEYITILSKKSEGDVITSVDKIIDRVSNGDNKRREALKKAIYGNIKTTDAEKKLYADKNKLKAEMGEFFLKFIKMNKSMVKENKDSYLHLKKDISLETLNELEAYEIKEGEVANVISGFKKYIEENMSTISNKYKELFKAEGYSKPEDLLDSFSYQEYTFDTMPVLFFTKTYIGYSLQVRASEINSKVIDYEKRYRIVGASTPFEDNITKDTETLIVGEGMTDFISLKDVLNTLKDAPGRATTGTYCVQSASDGTSKIKYLLKKFPNIKRVVFLNDNDNAGQILVDDIIEDYLVSNDNKDIKFLNATEMLGKFLNKEDFDISDLKIDNKEDFTKFLTSLMANNPKIKYIGKDFKDKLELLSRNQLNKNACIVNENDYFYRDDMIEEYKSGKKMYIQVGGKNKNPQYDKYIELKTESQLFQYLKGKNLKDTLFQPYVKEEYQVPKYTYEDALNIINKYKDLEEYKILSDEDKSRVTERVKEGLSAFEYVYKEMRSFDVDKSNNFISYFFEAKTLCDYMKKKSIIYDTVGSASGSVIAKLFGITNVTLKDLIDGDEVAEQRYLNKFVDTKNFLPDFDFVIPTEKDTKSDLESFIRKIGYKKAFLGKKDNLVPHGVKLFHEQTVIGEKTNLQYIYADANILKKKLTAIDMLGRVYMNPIQDLARSLGMTNINDLKKLLKINNEYYCSINDLEEGIVGSYEMPQFTSNALKAAHKYYDVEYEYEYAVKTIKVGEIKYFYKIKNTENLFVDELGNSYSEFRGVITGLYQKSTEKGYEITERKDNIFETPKYLNIEEQNKYNNNIAKRNKIFYISEEDMGYFTALSRPFYLDDYTTVTVNGKEFLLDIDKDNGTISVVGNSGAVLKYEDIKTSISPVKDSDDKSNTSSIKIIVNESKSKYANDTKYGKVASDMRVSKYFILNKQGKSYIIPFKYINKDITEIPKKDFQEIDKEQSSGKKFIKSGTKMYIWATREEEYNGKVNEFNGYSLETTGTENAPEIKGEVLEVYTDFFENKYTLIKENGKEILLNKYGNKLEFLEKVADGFSRLKVKLSQTVKGKKKEFRTTLTKQIEGLNYFEGKDTDFTTTNSSILNGLGFESGTAKFTRVKNLLLEKFLTGTRDNKGSNISVLEHTHGVLMSQEDIMRFVSSIYEKRYTDKEEYFAKVTKIRSAFSNPNRVSVEDKTEIINNYMLELHDIVEKDNSYPEEEKQEIFILIEEQLKRMAYLFNSSHLSATVTTGILAAVGQRDLTYINNVVLTVEEENVLNKMYDKFPTLIEKINGKTYLNAKMKKSFSYILEVVKIMRNNEKHYIGNLIPAKTIDFLIEKRTTTENLEQTIEMLINSYCSKAKIDGINKDFLINIKTINLKDLQKDIIKEETLETAEPIKITQDIPTQNKEEIVVTDNFTKNEMYILNDLYTNLNNTLIKKENNKFILDNSIAKNIKYIYEMNLILLGVTENFETFNGADKTVAFLISQRNLVKTQEQKKELLLKITNSYINKRQLSEKESEVLIHLSNKMSINDGDFKKKIQPKSEIEQDNKGNMQEEIYTNDELRIIESIYDRNQTLIKKENNAFLMEDTIHKNFKYIYEMNLIIFGKENDFLTQKNEKIVQYILNKRNDHNETKHSLLKYRKALAVSLTNAFVNNKKIIGPEIEFLKDITQAMITPPIGIIGVEEIVSPKQPEHKF